MGTREPLETVRGARSLVRAEWRVLPTVTLIGTAGTCASAFVRTEIISFEDAVVHALTIGRHYLC